MATYTGTPGNDAWTVVNPGTFTLDGLGGSDTLYLGTSLRSDYHITRTADGAVHVDSVSGASATLHATLLNMEKLVFNSRHDVLDLSAYFGDPAPQTLTGTAGNDLIAASTTSASIDGLGGIDTVSFGQAHTAYTLARMSSGYQVTAKDSGATEQLAHVERLQFADLHVALYLDGHAGQVAKILGAVFGAEAVANTSYAGIGLQLLDGGMSYPDLAALAVGVTGTTRPDDIVTLLWNHVVGTAPTEADKAPFVAMLDHGMSVGDLTVMAADTTLNTTQIDLVGLTQTGLDFT